MESLQIAGGGRPLWANSDSSYGLAEGYAARPAASGRASSLRCDRPASVGPRARSHGSQRAFRDSRLLPRSENEMLEETTLGKRSSPDVNRIECFC